MKMVARALILPMGAGKRSCEGTVNAREGLGR